VALVVAVAALADASDAFVEAVVALADASEDLVVAVAASLAALVADVAAAALDDDAWSFREVSSLLAEPRVVDMELASARRAVKFSVS
jgi:hypothetical protein